MDEASGRGILWSIVLVGGDGVQIKEFIRCWLGYEKPKEYRAVATSRSMFKHTLNSAVRPETSDVLGQPARSADMPAKVGKQPAPAAEPLPFLYQG